MISDEMDRSDAAFAVYRDGVARLGGLQSGGYSTEWVEVWTAAAGWRRARPLRGERAGACAVTLADGTIAVLSGELVDSSLTGGELDIEYRSSGRKTRRLGSGLIGTPDDGWRLITAPEAYVSQALRVPRSKEEIIVLSGLSGVFVIRP